MSRLSPEYNGLRGNILPTVGPAHLFGIPYNKRILDTRHIVDLSALDLLEREAGAAERLWLVLWQDHLSDPTSLVQSALVEACHRLPIHEDFTNVGLLRFDIGGCRPLDQLSVPYVPMQAGFEVPISLEGYKIVQKSEVWEVGLWWRSHAPMIENYTVFVHLVGPDESMIAQHDHIAGADAYPTSAWRSGTRLRNRFFLWLPEEIPNPCHIRVGLYTAEGRIPLQDGEEWITIPVSTPIQ